MSAEPISIYREHYLNVSYGVRSWLFTKDHKRIALLFLASITLFFFLGGAFAVLIRLELLTPQGDLVQAETYNKLFTMHGIIMVFFFLIPSIPALLGNFLVPMMIGGIVQYVWHKVSPKTEDVYNIPLASGFITGEALVLLALAAAAFK